LLSGYESYRPSKMPAYSDPLVFNLLRYHWYSATQSHCPCGWVHHSWLMVSLMVSHELSHSSDRRHCTSDACWRLYPYMVCGMTVLACYLLLQQVIVVTIFNSIVTHCLIAANIPPLEVWKLEPGRRSQELNLGPLHNHAWVNAHQLAASQECLVRLDSIIAASIFYLFFILLYAKYNLLLYKSYSKNKKKIQQLYKNKRTKITNGKM